MEKYGLLARIAQSFVFPGELDSRIDDALAEIGKGMGLSRAYVFLEEPEGSTVAEAYEWAAPGVPPTIRDCAGIPWALAPRLRRSLGEGGFIQAAAGDGLVSELKRGSGPLPVLSLAAYPLRLDRASGGFIGLDDCGKARAWSEAERNFLEALAGLVSGALDRERRFRALAASERNFETLFETIDDLVFIVDRGGRILFANRAASERLGYGPDELRALAMADVHPSASRGEVRSVCAAVFGGGRQECQLGLLRKDGRTLPVETRAWLGSWNGEDCVFALSKDLSAERETLQKFTKMFANNPAIMAISQASDRRFVDVNLAFLEKLGYEREEVVGRTSTELGIFHDKDEWKLAGDELVGSGRIMNRQLRVRRKDGTELTGLFSGEIIESKGEMLFLTVMIDVSDRVELQARLENVVDGARLGTWEWNVQTGRTVFNERWAGIAGYRLAELAPVSIETWRRLVHPDDLAAADGLLEEHFRGESEIYECVVRMRHRDGRWIWAHERGKLVERDGGGRPLMMFGTQADVTEKKELEERVRELSLRDPLTGVYNRRFLMDRLDELLAEHRRGGRLFSLSMLDIDLFKSINDEYGHLAGDYVLRELSRLASEGLRPYDFVCRYGGEEFIVVSLNVERKQAEGIVSRILGKVRSGSFCHEGREIRFTFSAGIADSGEFGPSSGAGAEALIDLADRRLYRAKRGGRNRIESAGD